MNTNLQNLNKLLNSSYHFQGLCQLLCPWSSPRKQNINKEGKKRHTGANGKNKWSPLCSISLWYYLPLLSVIMSFGRNSRLSTSPGSMVELYIVEHRKKSSQCGTVIPNNCKTLKVMSSLKSLEQWWVWTWLLGGNNCSIAASFGCTWCGP